jgi:hypothetical protein
VRWLLIRYVTPLPSSLHTALVKPLVISSRGTWLPMRFRGHSDQPQPFSRLFQQMVDHPVLSRYFGSPGNSNIGVLHAWQSVLTKMQKSFARRGSIGALILGCLTSCGLVNAGVGLHPCWYWVPCRSGLPHPSPWLPPPQGCEQSPVCGVPPWWLPRLLIGDSTTVSQFVGNVGCMICSANITLSMMRDNRELGGSFHPMPGIRS